MPDHRRCNRVLLATDDPGHVVSWFYLQAGLNDSQKKQIRNPTIKQNSTNRMCWNGQRRVTRTYDAVTCPEARLGVAT